MAKELLDLHGVLSEDGPALVDSFLVSISNSNLKRARIMTGKGKGVVKKVVIDYLKKAQYQWEFEKMNNGSRNEGVIVIFLD